MPLATALTPSATSTATAAVRRQHLTSQLRALDTKEESLLDLAADPSVPKEKIRERLRGIAEERERLTDELNRTESNLAAGAAVIEAAL